MSGTRRIDWWYWLGLEVVIAGWLAGCPVCPELAVGLGTVQVLHYLALTGSFTAFPVQVRSAYLWILLFAMWEPLQPVLWMPFAGTAVLLATDYCTLARLLSLMPWNRSEPFSAELVRRVLLTPPADSPPASAVRGDYTPARLAEDCQ